MATTTNRLTNGQAQATPPRVFLSDEARLTEALVILRSEAEYALGQARWARSQGDAKALDRAIAKLGHIDDLCASALAQQ